MFKKTMLFAAVLLVAVLAGCACSATTVPSPTASLAPVATPTVEVIQPSPDTLTTPGMDNNPDAAAGSNPDAAAVNTPGAVQGSAVSITNFKEGTQVMEADVPQVISAIKAKYENVKIKTLKHAMHEDKQAYEVDIESGSTTKTIYVLPDGTVIEK